VGCIAYACKILVLTFATPGRANSLYGSQLADELSSQLVDLQKDVQVFDRGLLKTYVGVANLPSDSPKGDEEARFSVSLEFPKARCGSRFGVFRRLPQLRVLRFGLLQDGNSLLLDVPDQHHVLLWCATTHNELFAVS